MPPAKQACFLDSWRKFSLTLCSGVSGTIIQSPDYPANYPNNMDETFPIVVAQGNVIKVTLQIMDIEYHSSCSYDYVMARDGDGTVLMQKKCGLLPSPVVFTSRTNKVEIIFHSDRSINKSGFQLSWKEMDQNQGEASRILTSPNYPSRYPDNVHETYPLEAVAGKRIKMTFVDFDLEFDSSCRWDYLKVRRTITQA